MIVEIVTTGSELLLGQVINTNVAYMSARLNELGFDVVYQTTVGDNHDRMKAVLEHALSRADIVITSGGLGPTQGDITKEVSAEIFGRKLKSMLKVNDAWTNILLKDMLFGLKIIYVK